MIPSKCQMAIQVLPPELWTIVMECLDLESRLVAAHTCKTFFEAAVRTTTDWSTLKDRALEIVQDRQKVCFPILKLVKFRLDHPRHLPYCASFLDILHADGLIDYETLGKLLSADAAARIQSNQLQIPKRVLYRIWQPLFLAPAPEKKKPTSNGLMGLFGFGGINMVNLLGTLQNSVQEINDPTERLLHLTDAVLDRFRKEMVINDKFVVICFQKKLNKILYNLLRLEKFYHLDISAPNLKEAYWRASCKVGSTEHLNMFADVTTEQLLYAIREAPLDFLMVLWKMRRFLTNFYKSIQMAEYMPGKTYKQLQFVEWCKNHP